MCSTTSCGMRLNLEVNLHSPRTRELYTHISPPLALIGLPPPTGAAETPLAAGMTPPLVTRENQVAREEGPTDASILSPFPAWQPAAVEEVGTCDTIPWRVMCLSCPPSLPLFHVFRRNSSCGSTSFLRTNTTHTYMQSAVQ